MNTIQNQYCPSAPLELNTPINGSKDFTKVNWTSSNQEQDDVAAGLLWKKEKINKDVAALNFSLIQDAATLFCFNWNDYHEEETTILVREEETTIHVVHEKLNTNDEILNDDELQKVNELPEFNVPLDYDEMPEFQFYDYEKWNTFENGPEEESVVEETSDYALDEDIVQGFMKSIGTMEKAPPLEFEIFDSNVHYGNTNWLPTMNVEASKPLGYGLELNHLLQYCIMS